MLSELKLFFEDNSIATHAASSISNRRTIALSVAGQHFTFTKIDGKNKIQEGAPSAPDFEFTLPESVVKELVNRKFASAAEVGLFLFEHIFASDPAIKVGVRLNAGILTLVTQGYFGVLATGGTEIAAYLGKRGFSGMGKIKDALSRLKK